MAERYVDIDGRRVRVGPLAAAAALCHKHDGTPYTSKYYQWRVDNDTSDDPPPGRVMVVNPDDPDGPRIPWRDPVTGYPGYPLDDVAAWAARRPGPSSYRPSRVTPETLRRTEGREQVLVVARDGELSVLPGFSARDRGPTAIRGQAQPKGVAVIRAELERLGLLTPPAEGKSGEVRLTEVGATVLTRWGVRPTQE